MSQHVFAQHTCGHTETIAHPEWYDSSTIISKLNFIRKTPCDACRRKEQDAESAEWEKGRNLPRLRAGFNDRNTISFGRICRKRCCELLHSYCTNPDLFRKVFERIHLKNFSPAWAEQVALQYIAGITDARWFIEKGHYAEYILQDACGMAIMHEQLDLS